MFLTDDEKMMLNGDFGVGAQKCMELLEQSGRTRLVVKRGEQFVGVIRRKILERFLNTAKRYSLADIAKTPRFRTGRG